MVSFAANLMSILIAWDSSPSHVFDSQFFFFLGEHNLDAGTELFNELLVVSGLIWTHDVEAWIFFKISFHSCWS